MRGGANFTLPSILFCRWLDHVIKRYTCEHLNPKYQGGLQQYRLQAADTCGNERGTRENWGIKS